MPDPADGTAAPAARLDTRGLLCPLPVLLTAREIAKLPPGGRLVVEGDDRGILEDLPAWCAASGNRLVEIGEATEAPGGAAEAGNDARAEGRPAESGVQPGPGARPLIRAVVEKAGREPIGANLTLVPCASLPVGWAHGAQREP